jgi:hypothetical protein
LGISHPGEQGRGRSEQDVHPVLEELPERESALFKNFCVGRESAVRTRFKTRKDSYRFIVLIREHSMKETGGLSKLIEVWIVQAHIQDGLIQQAVQNCKISRLRGRSQSRQDEMPLTKLNLLGNLPQPGIFK